MFNVLLFSVLSSVASAHSAHVHGVATIDIAFDGKNGKIEFHAPASSIYGFEYEAKSVKDKANKEAGLKKFNDKVNDLFLFAADNKCEVKMDYNEVVQKENHADVNAVFNVVCEKTPTGTAVSFGVQKVFSRVKSVKVNVLTGDTQKSQEIKKDGEQVEL
ncbi:ZrgA family zinc uptake protein [Bdellovibrio sp. HCB209]|uniref:ZrgA family zinc uptake protein n=1 Tax=Bdellovibrio sp. HCB209 TaxID=3394354 RepID=UPI0039B439E4